LQKYIKPGQRYTDLFGKLSPSDFGLNFIKFVYGNTPQATAGWGPTKQEPAYPLGSMFLSRDGTLIPAGAKFAILYRDIAYIKWIGKPGDGHMDFMTKDDRDPRILAIDGLSFKKDKNTGQSTPPEVITYVNFYVMVKGSDLPAILSFKRTGIPEGRRLTQDMLVATNSGELPPWTLMFSLEAPRLEIDGALRWYHFVIKAAGHLPEAFLTKAEEMAAFAKNMAEFATEKLYAEAEDGVGKTKAVEGSVVSSPATAQPVSAPTVASTVNTAPPTTAPAIPPTTAPAATAPVAQTPEALF
jgi:hypothetical protein